MGNMLKFTQDDLEAVINLYVEYERVHDYQSPDAIRMAINDVIEGRLALDEFADSELAPVASTPDDELTRLRARVELLETRVRTMRQALGRIESIGYGTPIDQVHLAAIANGAIDLDDDLDGRMNPPLFPDDQQASA